MQPEALIQKAILAYLAAKKIFVFTVKNGGTWDPRGFYRATNQKKGIADIIGLTPDGTFLAIECKSAKGTLSEDQIKFLQDITDNNGIAFVARSVDDVKKKLEPAPIADITD
jgi:penicillin-binding protein-related factor A (putative recombinase)